jgi:hypothetical protein
VRATVLLLGLAWGCSSTPSDPAADAGLCPSAAESCPSPVPSYSKDIVPILNQSCTVCHSPGGIAGYPETTYEDVVSQTSPILSQVDSCMMPPSNYPLTPAQRQTLLAWLGPCGAPDN